jgi:N-methylhydantoinase A/oxoprolinase/acetone carboxylase beta subunit
MPGPAAYQLGGTDPTVTDCDLILGYIHPDYFLGGSMPLSERHARRALERRVATPLGIDVDEAAQRVRRLIDGLMGQEIYRQTAMKGYDPRDFTMFAFGGAGPVHACDVAEAADVGAIMTFPQGSEFNAFGVGTMAVLQTYERTRMVELFDGDEYTDDVSTFNDVAQGLIELAERDLAEEGFAAADGRRPYDLLLELDMQYGGQHHTVRLPSPRMLLGERDDVVAVCDAFNELFAATYGLGSIHPQGGVYVQLFRLVAIAEAARLGEVQPPQRAHRDGEVLKGIRPAWWRQAGAVVDTPVYERGLLPSGFSVEGPALLEDIDTVVVVSPSWRIEIDHRGTGHLRRVG